jgi:hypothetical protein
VLGWVELWPHPPPLGRHERGVGFSLGYGILDYPESTLRCRALPHEVEQYHQARAWLDEPGVRSKLDRLDEHIRTEHEEPSLQIRDLQSVVKGGTLLCNVTA